MNVFDFDKTIYDGDSTFDFYRFSLLRHRKIFLRLPRVLYDFLLYKFGKTTKTEFKEKMYLFLTDIDDIDSEISVFWDKNIKKIKKFYKEIQKEDDLIISASPEFLVFPACERIGIKNMMASRVNKKTGVYTGVNCHGEEKVVRFLEGFPDEVIDDFYSDSYSDSPLARLATNKSYIVKKEKLKDWKF